MLANLKLQEIFGISNDEAFEKIALEVYEHQKNNNPVYQNYLKQINRFDQKIDHTRNIPFLPISFFKTHKVICDKETSQVIFKSSGTGGTTSNHYVSDINIYETSYMEGFHHFYGNVEDYTILALLPSYLERSGSSLIYMTEDLIKKSKSELSGFFLRNHEDLTKTLHQALDSTKKILLIGVSFALLDFAEKFQLDLSDAIIMETGGMKGKREEITRDQLHLILSNAFNTQNIHSEYGMTELLSQAYSKGNGIFKCPPWMKIQFRDTYDPFCSKEHAGGINIIDLANINSCSFIETSDLGRRKENGFEILGRLDNSDIRGCNLMIQ